MGVDPGVTTGWAYGEFSIDSIVDDNEKLFPFPGGCISMTFGQLTGDEDKQADDIVRMAIERGVWFFVIEDFELRKLLKSRELLSPVRIGHKISYGIWSWNARMAPDDRPIIIEWQLPALAMTTATDDRLKLWNLHHRGKEHARDAVRHVVTFARRLKSDRDMQYKMGIEKYNPA